MAGLKSVPAPSGAVLPTLTSPPARADAAPPPLPPHSHLHSLPLPHPLPLLPGGWWRGEPLRAAPVDRPGGAPPPPPATAGLKSVAAPSAAPARPPNAAATPPLPGSHPSLSRNPWTAGGCSGDPRLDPASPCTDSSIYAHRLNITQEVCRDNVIAFMDTSQEEHNRFTKQQDDDVFFDQMQVILILPPHSWRTSTSRSPNTQFAWLEDAKPAQSLNDHLDIDDKVIKASAVTIMCECKLVEQLLEIYMVMKVEACFLDFDMAMRLERLLEI